MNTLFRSMIAITVLVSARTAHADCLITGLRPDEAMLLTSGVGQEFSFVASGCVELRFHVADPKLIKIPRAGLDGSEKDATYKVVLTEREWNRVSDGRDEFTWSIIGRPSRGWPTVATQTNDIDREAHVKLSVAEADARIAGEALGDAAGATVSGASPAAREGSRSSDVNGDGNDDLLIGAPGKWSSADDEWGSAGAAYLVLGPVPETLDLSDADARFAGGDLGDEAGDSVSVVGDVDDDGFDDLLIGAPGDDEAGEDVGAAYLLYGPVTGRVNLEDHADLKFLGEAAEGAEEFSVAAGFSVSGTGDVTGDDRDDLLIGSFWHSDTEPRTGAAYLVSGATATGSGPTFDLSDADVTVLGPTREGDFGLGVNVARAGDMDGDGSDDLAIGTDWNDEFEGPAGVSWTLSDPRDMVVKGGRADGLVQFVPESEADSASAIAGAGDVSGDGQNDLLIGASDNLSGGLRAGKAYLIPGPLPEDENVYLEEALAQFVGETPGDLAGDHVSGAGDVNGDGNDDILIGACGNNDDAGAAYLFLGPITGTMGLSRADAKLMGEAADDCAGFGVSSAGDVDADGLADVLVGAPGVADGAGAAYVFGGATLTTLIGSP
jgi:hypothetical protein